MRRTLFGKWGLVFLVFGLALGMLFSQGNLQQEVRKYAVVMKDANIRSMPSTQGKILYVARSGEKLEVLEDLGTWIKVRIPTGGTGFVWAKLVRIEIEKILKPAPKPVAPPTPTSAKPSPKPSVVTNQAKFGFDFNFNYAMVSPGDFNVLPEGMDNYLKEWKVFHESITGKTAQIDHPMEKLSHMIGGGIEAKYFFTPNVALGLGFSYFTGSKTSTSTLTSESSEVAHATLNSKASILTPYIGASFVIPASDIFSAEVFLDGGFFMGNFSFDGGTGSGSLNYSFKLTNVKKSTLGFIGGAKLNFHIQPNMGIFLVGKYTLAKFKDLKGDFEDSAGVSRSGDVYYYECNMCILSIYPMLEAFEEDPSSYFWVKNARKAEFNFSGFYFGLGFFYRF